VESSLDQALTASKRMESFIAAIRKQNRKQDSLAEFSLNEEINQVIKLLDYKAKSLNVKLIFQSAPEIRSFGKSWQFYQVVNNLVSNAVDSYENFALGDKRRKEVVIQLNEHHGRAHLVVYDDGPGISRDLHGKVFEPFYSTKPEHKGTGIGLAIVKTIVEQDCRGTIKVESDGFSGTTFIVEFPLIPVPNNEL
jgi:signal transduction histidine kinase